MKKYLILLLCFNLTVLPAFCLIEDDFVENSLSENLEIKKYKKPYIVDDFAENNLKRNAVNNKKVELNEMIPLAPKGSSFNKKIAVIDEEDFIPIKIKIRSAFSTQQAFDEGDYIDFETLTDLNIGNKLYPKNSTVKARVETISGNKTRGIPADLTVGNFSLDNIPLQGEINKTGANRSLWVYPAMCAGCIFFGAGLLLIFVRGGHAKIKPNEIYTVYLKQ